MTRPAVDPYYLNMMSASGWAQVRPKEFKDPGLGKALLVVEKTVKGIEVPPLELDEVTPKAIEAVEKALAKLRADLRTLADVARAVERQGRVAEGALQDELKGKDGAEQRAWKDAQQFAARAASAAAALAGKLR